MPLTKERLLELVDGLIKTGERLATGGYRLVQGEGYTGIAEDYPAGADEYAKWDAACVHFASLLGKTSEHWAKTFGGTSMGMGGLWAQRRLGNLRALKEAIEQGTIELETSPSADRRASHSGHTMLHTTKADALARLERALTALPTGKTHRSMIFTAWHTQTLNDLKTIFGPDSQIVYQFGIIQFQSNMSVRLSRTDIERYGEAGADKMADEAETQRNREAYDDGYNRAEMSLKELLEIVEAQPDVPPNPAPAGTSHQQSAPKHSHPPVGQTINVAGNYIANHQNNSPHATQNVSISINHQVLEQVSKIKSAVDASDELGPDDKEDLRHELDHVCEIAKREPSEKTKRGINDKLTTIEKTLNVATKTAAIVKPGLIALRLLLAAHGI